jgi:hypothetical protein
MTPMLLILRHRRRLATIAGMNYSLRSLMWAVGLGPPLLAGLYVLVTQPPSWEVWTILAGWPIIFGLFVAYYARAAAKARKGAFCSFCGRWQAEVGDMAEAGTRGIFIFAIRARTVAKSLSREDVANVGGSLLITNGPKTTCPTLHHPPRIRRSRDP